MLFFTLVGFGLRLQKLGLQPLWGDEGWSFYFAGQSLSKLLALTALDIHPPLYYILLKAWLLGLGTGAEEARLFSVVIGTLLIPVMGLVGQRLYGSRVGLVAAATTAVMPMAIYYSQEVRMYGLVTLLGAMSVYFFLKGDKATMLSARSGLTNPARSFGSTGLVTGRFGLPGTRAMDPLQAKTAPTQNLIWSIGYVATTTAALYTMYYAAFIVLMQGMYVLFTLRRQPGLLMRRLRPFVYIGLLYLPWLLYTAPRLVDYIANKRQVEGYLPLKFVPFVSDHIVAFSLGHLPANLPGYAWVALAVIIVALLGMTASIYLRGRHRLLLYLYLLGPLLLGYIVNRLYPFTPRFFERTLLLAAPAYWLFIARGVVWLWQRHYGLAGTGVVAMLLAVTVSLAGFYTILRYPDEDYRPLLQDIAARATAEDTILASYQWQLGYYQAYLPPPRPRLFAVPEWGAGWSSETANPAQLATDLMLIFDRSPRLWFPAYQAGGHIWEDEAETAIANLGYPALLQWYSPQTKLTLAGSGQRSWRPVPTRQQTLVREQDFVADFENRLTLLEAGLGSGEYEAGRDIVPVKLVWRKETDLGSEHRVSLRLVDGLGRTWASRDSHPRAGQSLFTDMATGVTLLDRHGLLTPAGAPPGPYRLLLAVRRVNDDHPLDLLDEAGQPLGAELLLGDVALVDPDPPVRATALPVQVEVGDVFGQQVRLVGYSLGQGPFKAGEVLAFTLFWESLSGGLEPLTVGIDLQNTSGQSVMSHQQEPSWPASAWRRGTILQDPHDFTLPPTLAPGEYQLVVSLFTMEQKRLKIKGQEQVRLAAVTTVDRPHVFEAPAPEFDLAVNFGEQARLVGLDLPRTRVEAGQNVQLALYWQAVAPFDKSWTVFVHLIDAEGNITSQKDQIPGEGQFPTTGWLPQEYLVDNYTLFIPPETSAGQDQYHLKIGLYDANDFSRLPVIEGGQMVDDHVVLESWPITVE